MATTAPSPCLKPLLSKRQETNNRFEYLIQYLELSNMIPNVLYKPSHIHTRCVGQSRLSRVCPRTDVSVHWVDATCVNFNENLPNEIIFAEQADIERNYGRILCALNVAKFSTIILEPQTTQVTKNEFGLFKRSTPIAIRQTNVCSLQHLHQTLLKQDH